MIDRGLLSYKRSELAETKYKLGVGERVDITRCLYLIISVLIVLIEWILYETPLKPQK